jgi:predicted PurR-regulated permease PerM
MEMMEMRKNLKYIINLVISLIVLLLCIFLLPRLVIFFMPFVIGWIISCIANPLVVFLENKLKIKRKAGIVVVILGAIAAVVGIGYGVGVLLIKQIIGFIGDIPSMWSNVRSDFDNLGKIVSQYIDIKNPQFTDTMNDFGNTIGEAIASIPSNFDFTSFE